MTSRLATSPHPALGIDHGEARVGLAATDDFGILAHPVETIDCSLIDPVTRIACIAGLSPMSDTPFVTCSVSWR